jgi:four helix bundle protein
MKCMASFRSGINRCVKIISMGKIEKFEDLPVWKDAVRIAVKVYHVSSRGSLSKDYASRDQIRRAALSISNNIAEGFEYNNHRQFARFLRYSKGSAGELRSNLLIMKEAMLLPEDDYLLLQDDLVNLSRSLEGFIKYLNNIKW